jgi:hypothetical protein
MMATNLLQGMHMGATEQDALIYGAAALAIDLFGVGVVSVLAGQAKRRGNHGLVRKYTAISVFSGALSLLMFFGYNATTRIEPTRQAAQQYSNELTAQTKSETLSKQSREQAIAFANKNAMELAIKAADRKLTTEQRAAFEREAKQWRDKAIDASFGTIKVEAGPVEKTPDAFSKTLSDMTDIPVAVIQSILACLVAGAVLTIGSVLLRQGAADWPKPPAAPAFAGARTFTVIDGGHVLHQVEPEHQIREWIRASTVLPKPGTPAPSVTATDCYRSYLMFARHNRWGEIDRRHFMRVLARLAKQGKIDMVRDESGSGNSIHYVGRHINWQLPWVVGYEPAPRRATG